jgi:hypothetical protein
MPARSEARTGMSVRRERARRRGRLVAVLGCWVLLSTGCTGLQVGAPNDVPDCASPDRQVGEALVLVAQSVPSAQLLPCLRSLPVGWIFHMLDVQRGRTRVLLSSGDRDGEHAVALVLEGSCDVAGAREMPSEQPGTRRYDRVLHVIPGYRADRYYVFPGGCVTRRFDLRGRAGAEAAEVVSAGLGFVSRSTVAATVSERSHGRLTLDPEGQR